MAAAGAAFLAGLVGYRMAFVGTAWGSAVRISPRRWHNERVAAVSWPLLACIMSALLLAPLLHAANGFYGNSFVVDAILTTFWLWLGFAGTTLYIRSGFQWPKGGVLAVLLFELCILEVMAVAIGIGG